MADNDKPAATRVVACPHCGKPVEWSEKSPWKPFCSERCRMVDLGEWFDESHAIPGESADEDGRQNRSD